MVKRFGAVLIAFMLASCTPEEPETTVDWAVFDKAEQQAAAAQQTSPASPATRGNIGALLNTARAQNGLKPLSRSDKLTAAAAVHAQDMATNGFFSHTGSDKSKPSRRVSRQGYGFCFVAENIAQGWKTSDQVMAGWMASPGHRANNLRREATEYGWARAPGNLWVLVFAKPGC